MCILYIYIREEKTINGEKYLWFSDLNSEVIVQFQLIMLQNPLSGGKQSVSLTKIHKYPINNS